MGLISWLAEKMNGAPVKVNGEGWAGEISELYADACYRELAMWNAIDLIAKSISKCEFKEFQAGKEKKGPEWYRWNVEPNKNQNSTEFLRKLIFMLYYRGDCLVVGEGDQLLVADSFVREPYVLYEDIFSQVTIDDFTFRKNFSGSEVFYWNINSLGDGKSIQPVLKLMLESYAKLLAYGMKSYKTSRGNKAIFRYDTIPVPEENKNEWIKNQYDKFGKFLSADSGIAAVGKGTDLVSFQPERKASYSTENTRDIRSMIDDISDFTAKAFGIPPALLRGDVEGISDALDQFLTFCIDPLADMLHEEIVRKSIGRTKVLQGYDLQIDTSAIKHIDIIDAANGIDKLIGSGVCSINDILKLLGRTPINEPWADRHNLTKNYEPLDTN